MPPAFPPAGHIEPSPKRIQAIHNHTQILDTKSALLVWEHQYYPAIYVPSEDLKKGVLEAPNDRVLDASPAQDFANKLADLKLTDGGALRVLKVGDVVVEDVLLLESGKLAGHVRIPFDKIDLWLEESVPMHVHIRDPYKRIDTLQSSRHIVVKIDGTVMAETRSPTLLFETGLPTRYYLPIDSLNWNYIHGSDTVTKCPYKGEANYYSVLFNGKEYKDVIWYYKYPIAESLAVAGLICFYNEKVEILIDGVKEEKPKTRWS